MAEIIKISCEGGEKRERERERERLSSSWRIARQRPDTGDEVMVVWW